MDSCDRCGEELRGPEAGICKSCRQFLQENPPVQAEPPPPPAPKKAEPAQKKVTPSKFKRPSA